MLIFLLLIIEGLICFVLRDILPESEKLSLIIIIINSIFIMAYLSTKIKEKGYYKLIVLGYILRLFALLWDIYGRSIYYLPHSGSDTEGFYAQGMLIANNLELFGTLSMGAYANLLGLFFYLFGDQRILAQFLNTLVGLGILVAVFKILNLLEIEERIKKIILVLITFFPQAIIFSGILLRENLVSFGTIMMTYYLIKWYKKPSFQNVILSFVFLLVAVYFHSGVVGAFIPLAFMFAFYKHNTRSFKIDIKAPFLLGVFLVIGIYSSIMYGDVIFNKFGNADLTSEEFYQSMGADVEAGSQYLQGLTYNSFYDVLLYSPLKMFYFLYSPVPLDWRGMMDIITFFLDSLVYFIISIYVLRYSKSLTKDKPLVIILLLLLIIVLFTFAYGTIAAGTAVRHRNKFLAILLVIWAIVMDRNNKKKLVNQRLQTV
jgi:hypothetical protein